MVCDSPYTAIKRDTVLNGKYYSEDVVVPCGKCPLCKKRRVASWVFRLEEEDRVSSSSYFITLTYDDNNLPKSENGYPTLNKKDFQNFMKKLRKCQKKKIKYYAVGEYGEKRFRPHYHAIVFNVMDVETLSESWSNGSIHMGTVTGGSVTYTTQYIDKNITIPSFDGDDRSKEFSLMSQGLGKSFLTPEMIKYYQDDISRMYVSRYDGVKTPMPRYYKNKIFTEKQRKQQVGIVKEKMLEKELRLETEYYNKVPKGITYEEHKERLKIGRYHRFYNLQKDRNE